MANAAVKRTTALENILGPRHEPEVEKAEASLKVARLAMPTPMLDIVLRNGKMRSFSYAYLSEVEFEPGDTLTLKFTSGAEVIVEGRGLGEHRQQVRQHRADYIQESTDSELALQDEGVTQVERITITEGDMR